MSVALTCQQETFFEAMMASVGTVHVSVGQAVLKPSEPHISWLHTHTHTHTYTHTPSVDLSEESSLIFPRVTDMCLLLETVVQCTE